MIDQDSRFHSESEIVTNMSAGYRIHSQVHLRQGQPTSEDLLPQSHPGSSGRWEAGAYRVYLYAVLRCPEPCKRSNFVTLMIFAQYSHLISAHARCEPVGGGCAAVERHVTGADDGAPQQPRGRPSQVQLLPSSTEV